MQSRLCGNPLGSSTPASAGEAGEILQTRARSELVAAYSLGRQACTTKGLLNAVRLSQTLAAVAARERGRREPNREKSKRAFTGTLEASDRSVRA